MDDTSTVHLGHKHIAGVREKFADYQRQAESVCTLEAGLKRNLRTLAVLPAPNEWNFGAAP